MATKKETDVMVDESVVTVEQQETAETVLDTIEVAEAPKRATRAKKTAEPSADGVETVAEEIAEESATEPVAEAEPQETTETPKPAAKPRAPRPTNVHKDAGSVRLGRFVRDNVETEFEDSDVLAESDEEQFRWNELLQKFRRHVIVEDFVRAVDSDDKLRKVDILTYCEGFQVRIPDAEFFDPDSLPSSYAEMSNEDKYLYRRRRARLMSGARISYVIKGASRKVGEYENDNGVVGSRIEALNRKREEYFFSDDIAPSKRVTSVIENGVGSVLEARILTRAPEGIRVEALGVESLIYVDDISGRHWVHSCEDERDLKVGGKIRVVVMGLTVDKEKRTVRMRLSKRHLELDRMKENAKKMKRGMVSSGQVVAQNREKKLYTVALDCDVIASVREDRVRGNEKLMLGNRVVVLVTEVNSEKGYVMGSCVLQS